MVIVGQDPSPAADALVGPRSAAHEWGRAHGLDCCHKAWFGAECRSKHEKKRRPRGRSRNLQVALLRSESPAGYYLLPFQYPVLQVEQPW